MAVYSIDSHHFLYTSLFSFNAFLQYIHRIPYCKTAKEIHYGHKKLL
ncbi:hypothetical protein QW060_18460 [Myroides ceti]|uniref:Uncharacterized protein n=1 Tax=Paenimyroides ceti TaxID=395087 RepID=A0ABT8D1B4_9FLAO|nr:hypothetical protein [Paenimyroides ceti]MDN3707811.1 hypothetical protein [Paenimyroides ceti]MDN3709044.1 hypothetical protein [Paenimyroides ceti]